MESDIPEPYGEPENTPRVCDYFRRIHAVCGQWPWDLFPNHTSTRFPETLTYYLMGAIEAASSSNYTVTPSELIEYIGTGPLKVTHCKKALDWVKHHPNSERAGATTKSLRSRRSPVNSQRQGQAEIYDQRHTPPTGSTLTLPSCQPELPVTSPDTVMTDEPLDSAEKAATATLHSRQPEASSQVTERVEVLDGDALSATELTDDSDMHSDMILDHDDTYHLSGSPQQSRQIGELDDNEEIAASRLQLEQNNTRLQKLRCELEQENKDYTSLQATIRENEETLVSRRSELVKASQLVEHRKDELQRHQTFTLTLDADSQSSMAVPISDARDRLAKSMEAKQLLNQDILSREKKRDEYEDELQTREQYIHMITRGITRVEEEIQTLKDRQEDLLLTRDLRRLSRQGLERILNAGNRCLELIE